MNIADLYRTYRTCKIDTQCIFFFNKAEFIRLVGHTFVAGAGQSPAVKPLFSKFCYAHSAQSPALPRSKALLLQTPSPCSQLVHSVAIYARLSYEPSLHLPCCSPRRFQSAVTLIALPWQISHSCQEDTL